MRNAVKTRCAGAANLRICDCRFEIKQNIIEALQGYAQYEGNELCGVLTGSQIGADVFRISKVSPPCVKRNSRCGCERDAAKANAFIAKDFELSEHTRVYIGEWHTHPEAYPTPSAIDHASIVENFHTATLATPILLMVVVGVDGLYVSVYDGWRFQEVGTVIV